MKTSISILFTTISLFFISCNPKVQKKSQENIDWIQNATIYEVNIRQYTDEGTFKAFESHLPRLKELGIKVLWIMPIHPISEKKEKAH